ncbi:transposase, partial [bacterium]|nr:transposase [bacterium]
PASSWQPLRRSVPCVPAGSWRSYGHGAHDALEEGVRAMDPRGWHSRGYLPHLNGGEIVQMVTFRLYGSLPRDVIERLRWELRKLPPATAETELHRRLEEHLDGAHGPTRLREPRVAELVQATLLQFDGTRYNIVAWAIMSNHVHALVRPLDPHDLSDIVFSWRSYSANQANRLLGRRGKFWDRDYFDRFIRDEAHLARAIEYTEMNPVKAGLCVEPEAWPFSSAAWRRGSP